MEPSHRLTWVCIWGVPLTAWDAENFARFVSAYGDLVELDAMTEERSRVDIARVLIHTEHKPVIDGTVAIVVDGTHFLLKLREEFGCQRGNRSWMERLERLLPSPFSTEVAGSDGKGHMHGVRNFTSGSPLSLPSTWTSPCTEERRGRWRSPESPLRGDWNVNLKGAHVSHQACQGSLPALEGLTPGIGGQHGGNGSQPMALHENGRTEPTSPRPSQQQQLLREEDVGDKAKGASDHVWAKGGDPLDNNLEALLGVKLGSNEGDSAMCMRIKSSHILGLGGTGPNTTRSKTTSPLKVYVRKKAVTPAIHMGRAINSPDQHGIQADSRKLDIDENGRHTQSPAAQGTSLEKPRLAHSPISSNSFKKGLCENEEALHRDIIRDLGLSFAEINTCKDHIVADGTHSSIISTPTGVMGKKPIEP